jgi:hypothetical protein
LRKLKRRLNAAPTQVGLRDALADDLLKIAYAFSLDLLAFRLSFLALDAKFIFLRNVLLGLAIDGGDYGRGQFNATTSMSWRMKVSLSETRYDSSPSCDIIFSDSQQNSCGRRWQGLPRPARAHNGRSARQPTRRQSLYPG